MTTSDSTPPSGSGVDSGSAYGAFSEPSERLDLAVGLTELTTALVDVPSESGDEQLIADLVESALTELDHLEVTRLGNTVIARTNLGHSERVILGGHLDTVPANENLPAKLEGDRLIGLGTCDMKGGVAVSLKLAAELTNPSRDITYLYYECEEVDSARNGLAKMAQSDPELLAGDFAILMEPSNAGIEAGCQGSLRFELAVPGQRAHSARSWMGSNAIHHAAPILNLLDDYQPRVVEIDGLEYLEGLNAVGISGGVAGNVIPDATTVTINYRYAPSRSAQEAVEYVTELFVDYELTVVDNAGGALPGLGEPAAQEFASQVAEAPRPKYGWTDVSRFNELGIPAVNFGPGDPSMAHHKDEFVEVAQLDSVYTALMNWLS